MSEMNSLTLNGTTYDCFVDDVARSSVVICSASGESIAVSDSSGQPFVGLNLYGKSTQAGTPTPDVPVAIKSIGDVKVDVYGKNLIPFPYKESSPKTSNGMTYTVQTDRGIAVGGTPTANSSFILYKGAMPTTSTFTVSMSGTVKNAQLEVVLYNSENTSVVYLSTGAKSYIINPSNYPSATVIQIAVKRSEDNVAVSGTAYFQCELGGNATAHASYSKQAMVISGKLRGIPVTGNTLATYTDANGQMWCADEIDFDRVVRVQRIGIIESYTNENVSGAYLSTTGELSEGASVQYVLATPIETALTDEEIAAFEALHTNKPSTTVLNDSGAFMSVKYIADVKSYIDNKVSGVLTATVE